MKNNQTKRLTTLAMMATFALILSYVESRIPALVAIPGVKVGLANIVVIFVLYKLGLKEAITISAIGVFIVAMLFGSPVSMVYSLAGAVLSLGLMILFKSIKGLSTIGVSVIGGIAHNAGQIIVACIIMDTAQISFYLPILAISGTVAGILVGIAGNLLLSKIKKI